MLCLSAYLLLVLGFEGLVELTHRQEFKRFIRSTNQSQTVRVTREASEPVLQDEFEIDGHYYDVLHTEIQGDSISYICVEDKFESFLWEQFESQHQDMGGPYKKIITEFFKHLALNPPFFCTIDQICWESTHQSFPPYSAPPTAEWHAHHGQPPDTLN